MGDEDTSGRPAKRIRLATENELGSTASLRFLRHSAPFKIHDDRDNTYESMVSEVLVDLEASASIEEPLARELHNKFLVNIGFSLKLERLDQTLLLAKCLHALYQCTLICLEENCDANSAENYFGKQEIQQAFFIILQVLEELREKSSILNTSTSKSFEPICLQIMHRLTVTSPGLREIIRSNRNLLESILYAIVNTSVCTNCETSNFKEALKGILSTLRCLSPTAMRLGALVESILSGSCDLRKGPKEDQGFHINCLLMSFAPKKCLEDSRLREAISYTKKKCLGDNDLCPVVECFCLMAENLSMDTNLHRVFELMVEVLLERSKTNAASTIISVKCFRILLVTFSTRRMLLEYRDLHGVIQFLLDVVTDASECVDTVVQAGDLLCSVVMALQKSRPHKLKEQWDPFQLFSSLLLSDNQAVLSKAVSSTHELLKATNGTAINCDYGCKLAVLLAEACFRGFREEATQQEVVEIIQLLVEKNNFFLNFLTRQPSALSLIVHMASAENCAATRGAFSLLLQMSSNTCNHRIMARQPGLLSAFFRYARTGSNTNDQRERIKERILCLVKAL